MNWKPEPAILYLARDHSGEADKAERERLARNDADATMIVDLLADAKFEYELARAKYRALRTSFAECTRHDPREFLGLNYAGRIVRRRAPMKLKHRAAIEHFGEDTLRSLGLIAPARMVEYLHLRALHGDAT